MPANLLLNAYRTRQPIDAAPDAGPASVAQAYAVQNAVWREQVGEQRPSVWKVGAPNRQTEPTAAAVFPHRIARSPALFSAANFRNLSIEAEIALCFGRDLPARSAPYPRAELLAAIASAHVAMELIDTRLADPQAAGPLWRLADNLLNGGFVLGKEIADWRELDFSHLDFNHVDFNHLTARVEVNGQRVAETLGRPPLDDLFFCLPWWINHVGGAKAGDIVTTGAWNGAHPVNLPAEVSIEFLSRNNSLGLANARIC
jgi:2-keto-4-pentenoate hydratase